VGQGPQGDLARGLGAQTHKRANAQARAACALVKAATLAPSSCVTPRGVVARRPSRRRRSATLAASSLVLVVTRRDPRAARLARDDGHAYPLAYLDRCARAWDNSYDDAHPRAAPNKGETPNMDTTHKMRRPSWRDRLAAYADAHQYAVAIVTPSVPALVLLGLLVPTAAYDLGVSMRAAAVMVAVTALVVVAFGGVATMLVADVASARAASRAASAWRIRHDETRANRDAWRREAALWADAAESRDDVARQRADLARTRAEH
jgi:hypothetical protein